MGGAVPGLVLVSHSRALAEAVRTLVQQMTGDRVVIAVAAGVGEDGSGLGTDATAIAAAMETAASGPAGALVLIDLGSAVLSAGLALELIDPEIRARVRLSAGPLVEGAVAAGARAAGGATLDEVAAEAAGGLGGKAAELGEPEPAAPAGSAPEGIADAAIETEIADPFGLHARPAAALVMLAGGFAAELRVGNATTGAGPVAANSVVALSSLGIRGDHRVRVEARGADARAAVAAVVDLLRRPPSSPAPSGPARPAAQDPSGAGAALPAVPGVAIGPIFRLERRAAPLPASSGPAGDPEAEAGKLGRAVEAAAAGMKAAARGEAGGIFDAHLALLRDPALLGRARTLIATEGRGAATAWRAAVEEVAAVYAGLDDPYQRARAVDVRDVGDAVLAALVGRAAVALPDVGPCVLVADDLAPSEAVRLDPAIVLGVIDRAGAATSHAAILLRAAGIPAVSGAAALVPPAGGQVAALDGTTGEVWIDPPPAAEQAIRRREAAWRATRPLVASGPAVTRDGVQVALLANVSGPAGAVRPGIPDALNRDGTASVAVLCLFPRSIRAA